MTTKVVYGRIDEALSVRFNDKLATARLSKQEFILLAIEHFVDGSLDDLFLLPSNNGGDSSKKGSNEQYLMNKIETLEMKLNGLEVIGHPTITALITAIESLTERVLKLEAGTSPETQTEQGIEDKAPELSLVEDEGINTPNNENCPFRGDSERVIFEGDMENVEVEAESPITEGLSSTAPKGEDDDNQVHSNTDEQEKIEHDFREKLKIIPIGKPLTMKENRDDLLLLINIIDRVARATIDHKTLPKVASFRVNKKDLYKAYALPDFFWRYVEVKNINKGEMNDKGKPKNAMWQWTRIK